MYEKGHRHCCRAENSTEDSSFEFLYYVLLEYYLGTVLIGKGHCCSYRFNPTGMRLTFRYQVLLTSTVKTLQISMPVGTGNLIFMPGTVNIK